MIDELQKECFHLWFGPGQVMQAMHIVWSAEVSRPGQQGAVEAVMGAAEGNKGRETFFGVKSNFLSGIMKLINQIKCTRDYLLYNMVCFQCDKAVMNTSWKGLVCYF